MRALIIMLFLLVCGSLHAMPPPDYEKQNLSSDNGIHFNLAYYSQEYMNVDIETDALQTSKWINCNQSRIGKQQTSSFIAAYDQTFREKPKNYFSIRQGYIYQNRTGFINVNELLEDKTCRNYFSSKKGVH